MGIDALLTGNSTGDVECVSAAGCAAIGGLVVVLVCVVAAVVSFVVRGRRSVGVEREQVRWLVPPFMVLMVGLIFEFGGGQDSWVADLFLPMGLFFVPVAIGIAITRYRLFEIDRIISRTVAYVLVVGVLGAVYVAGAVWLPSVLVGEGHRRCSSPVPPWRWQPCSMQSGGGSRRGWIDASTGRSTTPSE